MRPELRARSGALVLAAFASAIVVVSACVGDSPTDDPCPAYCDDVLASCQGDNAAYDNREQCLEVCAFMPRGKEGDKTNSLACRAAQAEVASDKATCARAGAYGGGACGDRCETFCDLIEKNCIEPLGEAAPYPDKGSCKEACHQMVFDPDGGEGTAQAFEGEDTLNCRMYHLLLSIDARETHCPHTAVVSARCHDRDAGAPSGDAGADGGS